MPMRDTDRVAIAIVAATIALAPALHAGQGMQSVQYRSPDGVEYRSLPETDAIRSARAALDADPKNVARIIDLGVAQSGARQFREAIATFTRGLETEPNKTLLLRWRGHRYLSVREFDRAFADLTRGAALDSTIYGIWYHLGVVHYVRGEFADAAASFAKASPSPPMPASWQVPPTGCGCRSAGPDAARTRRPCSIGGRVRSRWPTHTRGACSCIAARLPLTP